MTSLIEEVAKAIDQIQLGWRFNNWTSDRVKGRPIEIFRTGEPETVLYRLPGEVEDGVGKLDEVMSATRSRAAIRATLEYFKDNVSDKVFEAGVKANDKYAAEIAPCSRMRASDAWEAMLTAALQEIGEA